MNAQARAEDIRWLAAARLGTTYDALEKYCRAHGLTAEWTALRSRESASIGHVRRGSIGMVLA